MEESKEKRTKREAIIFRVKKLREHAETKKNTGDIQEAESFAATAARLTLEYNLNEDEINAASAAKDNAERFKNWVYNEPILYRDNQSGNRWKLLLANVISKYNFCSIINFPKEKEFRVYGNMFNVDTVVYMYNFLSVGLLRIAQENHVKLPDIEKKLYNRYAYLKDFLLGAVAGINVKLRDDQLRAAQENNKVTALVLVNKEALDKYKDEVITGTRNTKMKTVKVGHGYETGYEVGKSYNIVDPLEQAKAKSAIEDKSRLLS